MLRVAASLGLLMGAVAFCVLGMVLIFMIVPSTWESLFGPALAPFAALGGMVLLIYLASRIMRFADRLLSDQESRGGWSRGWLGFGRRGRRHALAVADREVPADWQEYAAAIARNKRWAFYRRTQQFDRLAELDAELKRRAARPK